MMLIFPLVTVANGGGQISSTSTITFYGNVLEKENNKQQPAEISQTKYKKTLPLTKDTRLINQQFYLGVIILFIVKYGWNLKKKWKGFETDEEIN